MRSYSDTLTRTHTLYLSSKSTSGKKRNHTHPSPIETTAREDEPSEYAIMELQCAQEAFKREMEISRQVAATELEEVNMGTTDDP